MGEKPKYVERTEVVALTARAACMDPLCVYHVMASGGPSVGTMTVAELRDHVRAHVIETGHRVYVDDRRATIVARD